jgi:hypothetical protein
MASIRAHLSLTQENTKLTEIQVSIISVGNSIQSYSTLAYTSRVYSGRTAPVKTPSGTWLAKDSPATPLSGRTFGTWTVIQSLVRLYAAYNIDNPRFYELAFMTYAVAWGHFMSEWLYFRSTSWNPGMAFPVVIASGTLVWMLSQWSFYCS